jgi:trimethylamine--corrinoid protein Co-methyltransferase
MRLTVEALSEKDVVKVHEKTLALFEKLGVAVKSPEALELMRSRGIRIDGQRAYPSLKDVERALETVPPDFTVYSRNPERALTIGPGRPPALLSCSGVPVILLEDQSQRPVTFEDYKDMLRLTQTSPVINMANSGALYPAFPEPEKALYHQLWLTLTMTDLPLVGQSEGAALSHASVDMARAASGIFDKPVIVAVCNSLSQLAWDARMLEGIKIFAENLQPINVTCCSMSGATAPIQIIGSIIQANAEVLLGVIYSQLCGPGAPIVYGTTSSVMDMGAMGLALGAPEYTLISAGSAQMAVYYKMPFRGGGALTDAKILDGQAMAESAWNLVYSLGQNVHFMLQATGVLESFMSASFGKWIADEEILLKHLRLSRGLGGFPDDLEATFEQGLAAGGYLKLKSTLKRFRTELYRPTVGDRRSFEIWKSGGRSYHQECWAKVRQRLAGYQEPELEKEAREGMLAVMAKAGLRAGEA